MGAKILVVDDEADMVELLSFNLRQHGYEVLAAANGLEALNQARRHLPDVILLDLMLEGMDGYSVCEILRRQPSTADLPVIMITAVVGEIGRLNGMAAGADDYITKPFSPQKVLERIERILQIHAQKRAQMNSEADGSAQSQG